MTYVLTATSVEGCKASDQVNVKLLYKIKIPNAFSPNGDAINDVWNISNLSDYPGCVVDIFDRYGKQVFNSIGYNRPWNGTRNGTGERKRPFQAQRQRGLNPAGAGLRACHPVP